MDSLYYENYPRKQPHLGHLQITEKGCPMMLLVRCPSIKLLVQHRTTATGAELMEARTPVYQTTVRADTTNL